MLVAMTITDTESETMPIPERLLAELQHRIQTSGLSADDLTSSERRLILDHLADAACTRCHGSGREPGQLATDDQRDAMVKLFVSGQLRKRFSDKRNDADVRNLTTAWDEIRRIWREASAAGISQAQAARAVGVARPYFTARVGKGA